MKLTLPSSDPEAPAWRLELSPKTVESHRANIMRKLDVGSFAELVRDFSELEG